MTCLGVSRLSVGADPWTALPSSGAHSPVGESARARVPLIHLLVALPTASVHFLVAALMPSHATFFTVQKSVHVAVRSDVQIAEAATVEVRLARDVCPLTDFRAGVSAFIAKARRSDLPLIITQHGRSAAVLLSVAAYEHLCDEVELLREVRAAEDESAQCKSLRRFEEKTAARRGGGLRSFYSTWRRCRGVRSVESKFLS